MMSSVGEDAATGTVWERLCAVGIVLCKLFSGDKSTLSFEDGSMLTHDECINSSKEDENEHVVKRTSQRVSMQQSGSSNCIARLESKGFPQSIRALVINLLECGKGSYSEWG